MRKGLFLLVILSYLMISGCNPQSAVKVVSEFNNTPISLDEFENAYAKNVGGAQAAKNLPQSQMKDFLKLYTNFKMKLRDAYVRGYYKDEQLKSELEDYKKKIGVAFIKEKMIVDPGVRKFYEERKYEYRVSHILLGLESGAGETSKQLAQEIIDKIRNGASFDSMCVRYSEDSHSKDIAGDIYWLTSGMISDDFDKAITTTNVGDIYPYPVKSRYGYHIIKVTGKQLRIPEVRASHILINEKDEFGNTDSAKSMAIINEIQGKLKNGEDFGKLAMQYSIDRGTGQKGGDIGFFKRRMMMKEFDETVFKMKVGEISDPIKTDFGFHLIKLTDVKTYPPYEVEKERLRKGYDKSRYYKDLDKYISNLKREFGFVQNHSLINIIAANKDTVYFNSTIWDSKIRKSLKDSVSFTIANESFSVDSLFSFLINNEDFKGSQLNIDRFVRGTNAFASEMLLVKKGEEFESTNKEYKSLMDDYFSGILIFRLQQEEIWDKVSVDSVKLKEYFNLNKANYSYPDRVEYYEVYTKNDSLANVYHQQLLDGADFSEFALTHTERKGQKSKTGHYEMGPAAASVMATEAFRLENPGDISEVFAAGNGWAIVKLVQKDFARPKSFEESRPEVTSAYQEYLSKKLEDDYINRLKKRYNPKYYFEELDNAFTDSK